MSDLIGLFTKLNQKIEESLYETAKIGIVDNGTITTKAPGRPDNYIIVRMLTGQDAGTTPAVRNRGVAPVYDTTIRVRRDPVNHNEWITYDVDPKFELANPTTSPANVPFHRHYIGSGLDDPVEIRRFIAGRTWSNSALTINVDPFFYQWNGNNYFFTGIMNLDVSSHVPGSGFQRFVVIGIDPTTDDVTVIDGSTYSTAATLTPTQLLAISTGNIIVSAGILLTHGQTIIIEANIYDMRPLLSAVGSGVVTSFSVTAPIVNTGTSIAPNIGLTTPLAAPYGGTGVATLTAHALVVGNGTSAVNALAPGTKGNLPVSDGTDWVSTNVLPIIRTAPSTLLTESSNAVTITQTYHVIKAQSGTTDDLDTITSSINQLFIIIQPFTGHTITVKNGTGNIFLNGGADFSLTGDKTLVLFYDGTNWSDVGAGAGGGSSFYQTIQDTGVDQTQRSKLDFVGATITDDAGNDRTIVTLAGGGSSIIKTTKTFYQRTVLYDNTLGSAGTWDVSSIDQSYDHLEIILTARASINGIQNIGIYFNNDTTNSHYQGIYVQGFNVGGSGGGTISNNNFAGDVVGASSAPSMSTDHILIPNYTGADYKLHTTSAGSVQSGTSATATQTSGVWQDTSAINRIAIATQSGPNTFDVGSRLQIIGIKQEDVVTDVSGTGTVQFTQTATVTVSNTTTETTLVGSGVGSTTFAANALNAVGRTIRLKMWGILSDLGALPGNLTIKLKLGSTVLVTSGAVALVAGLTNALWELEFAATVRTTGATGTIMTNGVMRIVSALADTVEPLTNGTSTITIDFTGSLVADVTATFSTASASNAITSLNGLLEVLN